MDLLAHGEIACKAYFGLVFEDAVCSFVILFEIYPACWYFYWNLRKEKRLEQYLYLF
jgi:hypothetical protein